MHTEGVAFALRKSPCAQCAKSNILAQVLNQSVVYLERRVESLAVSMPQLNNTCTNFYAKYLTLNAGRQRLRCAWVIRDYSDWTHQRQFDDVKHDALVLERVLVNRSIHTGRVRAQRQLHVLEFVRLVTRC